MNEEKEKKVGTVRGRGRSYVRGLNTSRLKITLTPLAVAANDVGHSRFFLLSRTARITFGVRAYSSRRIFDSSREKKFVRLVTTCQMEKKWRWMIFFIGEPPLPMKLLSLQAGSMRTVDWADFRRWNSRRAAKWVKLRLNTRTTPTEPPDLYFPKRTKKFSYAGATIHVCVTIQLFFLCEMKIQYKNYKWIEIKKKVATNLFSCQDEKIDTGIMKSWWWYSGKSRTE